MLNAEYASDYAYPTPRPSPACLYQKSALPSLAALGSGGTVGVFSARAGVQLRHTRRVMGRVDCGAIDGREMYITVVSSATWNSHTRAYMHSSQITEIQHLRRRGRSYRQGFDPPWIVYSNSQIANS